MGSRSIAPLPMTSGRKTHICVSNVASSTHNIENGLGESLCGCLVLEQSRAEDANRVDARVVDLSVRFNTTTAKAGSHDLGSIYIGISALSGVGCSPVDRLLHNRGSCSTLLSRGTRGDGQIAVGSDLLEEQSVCRSISAAATVAPYEDRKFEARRS